MKRLLALAVIVVPTLAVAAPSYDYGTISQLYTAGNLAVLLPTGYPNAAASSQCPTANGWAGVSADPANATIKAVLMMAKATGSPVTIVIDGCAEGGAWYRIVNVYVQ
jgi:hypothetical protein